MLQMLELLVLVCYSGFNFDYRILSIIHQVLKYAE